MSGKPRDCWRGPKHWQGSDHRIGTKVKLALAVTGSRHNAKYMFVTQYFPDDYRETLYVSPHNRRREPWISESEVTQAQDWLAQLDGGEDAHRDGDVHLSSTALNQWKYDDVLLSGDCVSCSKVHTDTSASFLERNLRMALVRGHKCSAASGQ